MKQNITEDKLEIINERMYKLGMANIRLFHASMLFTVIVIIICNIFIENAIVLQVVAAIVSQFATASQSNAQLVNNYYFGSSPGARANTSAVTDGVKKIFDSYKREG